MGGLAPILCDIGKECTGISDSHVGLACLTGRVGLAYTGMSDKYCWVGV